MAYTWRQSMELKMANDQPEVPEEGDPELMLLLEPVEQTREKKFWPAETSNDKLNLGIDEEIVDETSKFIVEVKIADDTSGSYEELSNLIEKSEINEGVEEIEKSVLKEEYEDEIQAGVSDTFFVNDEVNDEVGEEEEEFYCTESSSGGREKLDDDSNGSTNPAEFDEADIGVLGDITVEILRDRQALIEKLRELKKDEPELKRKNRLLQYWVTKTMTKKHQTMTPDDETLSAREMDDRYVKKLISYKMTVDEMEARNSEIRNELDNHENNLRSVLEEDSVTFGQLLDREREIGVALVFEKSGRAIGVRSIEASIRRQVLRRDLLNRDRFTYISHCHRYEDVKTKLRLLETLGEGMTIMDYEMLRMENDGYREKLEDREKDLEKFNIKIQNILNTLAHYKEREVTNLADIYHEKEHLEIVRSEVLRNRESLSDLRQLLWRLRNICATKKRRAGMLFATPVVREMERMLKSLDEAKLELERIMRKEDRSTKYDREERRVTTASKRQIRVNEERTNVTKITGVKSQETRNMRPGRC